MALDKKAPLTMPIIILAMPSVSLRTTLPVKPSQTTTSTLPAGISRGSMLPTKRMPGVVLSFWWVSRSRGVPLDSSAPLLTRAQEGSWMPSTRFI